MDFVNGEIALHKESEYGFSLACAGELVGKVELYRNSSHSRNQYLRLHLSRYENAWAALLFSQLQQAVKNPMQVMTSSDDIEQRDLLLAGGFSCKRKCYEMEVTADIFYHPARQRRWKLRHRDGRNMLSVVNSYTIITKRPMLRSTR